MGGVHADNTRTVRTPFACTVQLITYCVDACTTRRLSVWDGDPHHEGEEYTAREECIINYNDFKEKIEIHVDGTQWEDRALCVLAPSLFM